jgi:hypothetical protein
MPGSWWVRLFLLSPPSLSFLLLTPDPFFVARFFLAGVRLARVAEVVHLDPGAHKSLD